MTKCQSRFVSVSHCSVSVSVLLMPGISQHSVYDNQCNGTSQKDHKHTEPNREITYQTEKIQPRMTATKFRLLVRICVYGGMGKCEW